MTTTTTTMETDHRHREQAGSYQRLEVVESDQNR